MTFQERLRMLREEKGVQQKDIADALGVSRQNISNYEVSGREPNYRTLSLLADYFGVTVDFLLGRSEYRSAQEALKGAALPPMPMGKAFDDFIRLCLRYEREGTMAGGLPYVLAAKAVLAALDAQGDSLRERQANAMQAFQQEVNTLVMHTYSMYVLYKNTGIDPYADEG